jgi:hypothetical protein
MQAIRAFFISPEIFRGAVRGAPSNPRNSWLVRKDKAMGIGGRPDDTMDLASMLDPGTSGVPDTTPIGSGDQFSGTEGELSPEMAQVFKFAGRQFKSQQDAEHWASQMYGKHSESKGILNQLKAALKNPKALAHFSKNPQMAQIMAKLGIEDAGRELEEESEAEGQEEMTPETFYEQIGMERAASALEREEWRFERKLGRPVTDDEHNSVMTIIARAQSLSYDEAWKLAFHDKMLIEIQKKHQQEREKSIRPRPGPTASFVPGVKMNLKKALTDMTPAEAREHLRNSDEFKGLMSRE